MLVLVSKSIMGFVWDWLDDRFGYMLVLLGEVLSLFMQTIIALAIPLPFVFHLFAFLIGSVLSGIWFSHLNIFFEIAPPDETGRFIGIATSLSQLKGGRKYPQSPDEVDVGYVWKIQDRGRTEPCQRRSAILG